MLYRIRNGLVAIPASAYLHSATALHTRGSETRYRQIQCNTNTHSHTFFPTAIWQWNTLPVDVSFKAQLNSVLLMWMPVGLVFILCTAPFLSVHRYYRLHHCFRFTHLDFLTAMWVGLSGRRRRRLVIPITEHSVATSAKGTALLLDTCR